MASSVDQLIRKAQKHAKRGETEKAAQLYRDLLSRFPGNARASQALAALQNGGPVAQAKPSRRLGPDTAPEAARTDIANLVGLFNKGQFRRAAETGQQLAKRYPRHAIVHNVLGAACSQLGEHVQAVQSFAAAAELEPGNAETHNNLGIALNESGRGKSAVACFEKALSIKPDFVAAHANLGNAYDDIGRHELAVESYQTALKLQPDLVQLHNNLGIALQQLGRFEEAARSFEAAIERNPDYAEAHVNLSGIKKFRAGDDQIAAIEDLLKNDLPDQHRERYHFVQGKAYDDLGEYSAAFRHFLEGNRLRKALLGYDIEQDRRLFADVKSVSYPETGHSNRGQSDESAATRPIFILGMPRSGTSLVEQILASHSSVTAGGELDAMTRAANALDWSGREIGDEALQGVRLEYQHALKQLELGSGLITDKMPLNFQWIGVIAPAFPDSPIIHTKRDPRAICWSLFRTRFSASGQRFAYDLEDAANFYLLHEDLMQFWHQQLPGRISDLDYDELTQDQEGQTRQLLGFAGLEWEDACLDFHRTNTAVRTASVVQVRQKMYRGSSEQWRNYEPFLGPMLDVLERRQIAD